MTKFQNEHDEYLWSGSVESGVVTGEGDVAGPVGWFAGITIESDLPEYPATAEERAALAFYGTRFLILHESNEGFVTVLTFDDEVKRNRRLIELGHAHNLGLAGIEESEIMAAISGYRQALEWHAGLDGKGLAWTEEAQRQTADDVTDFLIADVDAARSYLVTVKRDWSRFGGDFAFTRLGVGQGFAYFAAGEAVDDLVEAAKPYGPVSVVVNEQGEMEVQS